MMNPMGLGLGLGLGGDDDTGAGGPVPPIPAFEAQGAEPGQDALGNFALGESDDE